MLQMPAFPLVVNNKHNSLFQEVTRAHKGWALDSVVLHNEVTKFMSKDDVPAPPPEGVYVYGLYLEGAAWDKRNQRLIESKPKVLFELMPIILIDAVQTSRLNALFISTWSNFFSLAEYFPKSLGNFCGLYRTKCEKS